MTLTSAPVASAADSVDAAKSEGGSRECMPCAGRGIVISQLGGDPHNVSCPWCGGTGERQEGVDAQTRWLEEREQAAGQERSAGEPGQAAAQDQSAGESE
jgi:hypothetical protein